MNFIEHEVITRKYRVHKRYGLANDYYLKALEHYPWELSDFLEAINYALSYDEDHADAHCLFGRFYMEQLNKFNDAVYHFERALSADIDHIQTYYAFIRLTIQTEDYRKAHKLLEYASKIPGVDRSYLKHFEAIILEKQGHLKNSEKKLKELLKDETCNWVRDYVKKELNRVKEKQKDKNGTKSKKRKKTGKKKN